MSRVIDLAINEHIFFNQFENDDILNFSDNMTDCLSLLHVMSENTMENFFCFNNGKEYIVNVEDVDYHVKHKNIATALSLACLASVGLDKDYVLDIQYEYNFNKGIL